MHPGFCQQCGTRLPADAAFCEQCGKPVLSSRSTPEAERTIGHVPVRFDRASPDRFGRTKHATCEMVITTSRVLLLRGGFWEDDVWLGEQEELEALAELSGAHWREVIDTYALDGEVWQPLYTAPAEVMLGWHRESFGMPHESIRAAVVMLDPEGALDTLQLRLADGAELDFTIYLALGRHAVRFLREALGPNRVRTVG